MAAPIVIKHTDSGVPQLSGAEGTFASILRYAAALLDWDIPFDSGTKIVLRAKTGQRLFYRVDDRSARGGNAPYSAKIEAYESMSDIDTGSGYVGPVYCTKSDAANTDSRAWLISGDATYINFASNYRNSSWGVVTYGGVYCGFGDGVSVFPGITASTALLCGCSDAIYDSNTWALFSKIEDSYYRNRYMHRDISGANINVNAQLSHNSPFDCSLFGHVGKTNLPTYPYEGNLLLSRPVLGGLSFPQAFIPGLFNPLHKDGLLEGVVISDGTDTYFTVKCFYNSTYGAFLLKTGGEFRS